MKTQNLATVIIPAYNEAGSLGAVLTELSNTCKDIIHEIIVVDDGSEDDTAQIAAGFPDVRVIRHRMNRGYGSALKSGIREATTDIVLTMDSDGQHRAEDVRRLYEALDQQDMLVGQRTELLHSPFWRMPGKWLLNWMANYITGRKIPDLNSGLRVMRREVVRDYMHLCPSGFSFSTTITIALIMRGYAVEYVPIHVQKRVGKSTVTLRTGFDTIILIIRIAALFGPLRIFLPPAFLTIAVGILWAIPYSLAGYGVSVGSMLAIVTGILLFAIGILCDQISQLRLERYERGD